MIRKLLILAFMLSVGSSSLAAVPSYMDGEGCEAKCCRSSRQNKPEGSPSKLRCIVDCGQPGTTSSLSPASSIARARQKKSSDKLLAFRIEAIVSSRATQYRHLPTPLIRTSTDVYLKTGALLI
jgi:hypothetical protein